MPKGIDYSKWDSVELSDDDSDCHPNIEKDFWLRIKKEKREREKEDNAKDVLNLRKVADEKRAEASELREQAHTEADKARKADLEAEAAKATRAAEDSEAKADKIVEVERRRNWEVQDKFNFASVNVNKLEIGSKKKEKTTPKLATSATAPSSAGGAGSSGGQWEVIHQPGESAPAAAAPTEGQGDGAEAEEEDDEAALNAYVQDMEHKAQELGLLGNSEDCFEQSYEVIKKYPEIAVKETTDYLLLVGNDLAKKGEEELGRAFVHQSLMMQYCMDLSAGGANGVAQFFRRMNSPDASAREKARHHFETELQEYWGKILARARGIRKENEAKAEQEKMLEALKPPPESDGDADGAPSGSADSDVRH